MSTDTLYGKAPVISAATGRHWLMVGLSFIGLALGYTSMGFLSLGVFMTPLSQEFGWNRGEIALALSVGAIVLLFTTPVAGRLIDRIGVRRVLLPSIIGLGVSLLGMYFIQGVLWQFYLIFAIAGVLGTAANNVSYLRLLMAWFSEKRGMVIGIASAGTAAGQAISAYIVQSLIETHGWRVAYLGLGLTVLVVCFPIIALLIRDTPADVGLKPYGADDAFSQNRHAEFSMTKSEAIRTPVFWLLVLISFTMAIAMNGAQIHFVPLLMDRGVPPAEAAGTYVMLMSGGIIVGRLATGFLFDRFFAPRVAMLVFILPIVALLLMLKPFGSWSYHLLAILLGLGLGSESDILGYLTSRYFGMKAMAELYGYLFGAFMAGSAAGPAVYGFMQSAYGNYDAIIRGAAIALCGVCLIFAILPAFPGDVKGERK